VTSDIARCLDVGMPEAERLKIIYGDLAVDRWDADKKIAVNTKNGREDVSESLLCKVIDARMQEMMHWALRDLPYPVEPQAKVVLCGGGGQLGGLAAYVRKTLGRPVREGLPDLMRDIIENVTYAGAVGAVLYALKTRAVSYEAPLSKNFFQKSKHFFTHFFDE